jgi:hypothetical protein
MWLEEPLVKALKMRALEEDSSMAVVVTRFCKEGLAKGGRQKDKTA